MKYLKVFYLTLLVCSLVEVCADEQKKTNEEYYQGKIEMFLPLEISEILLYRDGGTVGVKLKDANGLEHLFCFDGRASERVKKLPSKIYYGATHPEHKGAKPLIPKGKNEKIILKYLQTWKPKNKTIKEKRLLELIEVLKKRNSE
jgi:hypothetical protein